MRAICEYTKKQGLCKGCVNEDQLCRPAKDCADQLAKDVSLYKSALEIIAGKSPCLDRLMGNPQIAEVALDTDKEVET